MPNILNSASIFNLSLNVFQLFSGQSLHRRQHRVQRPAGGRRPPLALRPPQELPEGAAGAPARPEELCRLPDVV